MLLHPNRQTRLALSWPMLKLISHTTKPCQGRVPKTSQFFVLSCPRPAHTKGAASRATSLVALVSFGTLPIHVSLTPSAVHLPKTMQQKGGPDQADPCPPPREGRFASHPCVVLSGPNIASDQLRDGGRYGYSLSRLPIAGSWPELPEAGTDITLLFVMARVGSTRCNIITALAEPAAVEIGYGRCPFSTAPFSDSSLSFSSA